MSDPQNDLVVMRVFRNIFDQHLRVDFHCREICVKLTFANKIVAMYERSRDNVKVEPRSTLFLSHFKTVNIDLATGRPMLGDPGFWIPHHGFRIPGTGFQSLSVERGLWIWIVSGSPDFLSCVPNFKAQDSRFHKQNFPRIPDSKSKNFPDSGIPTPLHGTTKQSNPPPPTLQPIPLPTEWILLRKVVLTFFSPILGIFILSAVHKLQVLAVSNQVLRSLEGRNPTKNQTKYVSYKHIM